jgi:hypothetical protein
MERDGGYIFHKRRECLRGVQRGELIMGINSTHFFLNFITIGDNF